MVRVSDPLFRQRLFGVDTIKNLEVSLLYRSDEP